MKATRMKPRKARREAQWWQAISSAAGTLELMMNVYGVLGEEAERIAENYGS
jgi:hypothetical protein